MSDEERVLEARALLSDDFFHTPFAQAHLLSLAKIWPNATPERLAEMMVEIMSSPDW